MNNQDKPIERVLAIDPTSRGIGFAVLEGPQSLIDWGVREAREDKNPQCISILEGLINHYQPSSIIVEDCSGKGSRRCERVQELIDAVFKVAERRMIKIRALSRYDVRQAFSTWDAYTKHQIALAIVKQFRELEPHMPPFRKVFMNEHYRMAVFDAIAFGLTYFYSIGREEMK